MERIQQGNQEEKHDSIILLFSNGGDGRGRDDGSKMEAISQILYRE